MFFRSSADFGRYLEVKEGLMGAGKSMLDSCLLERRSWFAPSNSCSKHACVLWGTSKSVAEAKLCETKAETYQVKKISKVDFEISKESYKIFKIFKIENRDFKISKSEISKFGNLNFSKFSIFNMIFNGKFSNTFSRFLKKHDFSI